MEEQVRISYAQSELLEIVAKRKLHEWCKERSLPHATVYKVAVGDTVPTYGVICMLLPYIEVSKWFFTTDEQIPFELRTLPAWNSDDIPYFVRKHKCDYMDLVRKYDLTEAFAKNLFQNHRAKPSLSLIRRCALEGINPEEFFTEGDKEEDGMFAPERGDVVSFFGKIILVLTSKSYNRSNHSITGVIYENGKPDFQSLQVISYVRNNPKFIKKVDSQELKEVTDQLRSILVL